jgi:Tat protein translocase TatB subunit
VCYTTGLSVMLNIGFGELVIICIVLIVAVGPDRLPSMMKSLGKTMRTLRQASKDLRESTGIDELLREDFDLRAPPRRPFTAPRPPEPATVSRSDDAVTPPMTPTAATSDSVATSEGVVTPPMTPDSNAAVPAAPDVAASAAPPVTGATLVGVGIPPITAPPPAGPSSQPPPAALPSSPQPGSGSPGDAPDNSKLHGG